MGSYEALRPLTSSSSTASIALKLSGIIVKSLKEGVANSDLIIYCTPMSEYKKMILRLKMEEQ